MRAPSEETRGQVDFAVALWYYMHPGADRFAPTDYSSCWQFAVAQTLVADAKVSLIVQSNDVSLPRVEMLVVNLVQRATLAPKYSCHPPLYNGYGTYLPSCRYAQYLSQ